MVAEQGGEMMRSQDGKTGFGSTGKILAEEHLERGPQRSDGRMLLGCGGEGGANVIASRILWQSWHPTSDPLVVEEHSSVCQNGSAGP